MDESAALGSVLAGRGLGPGRFTGRTVISAVEHETKILPPDMIGPGGRVDVYEDVLKRFDLRFKNGQPALQCGRWVGFIPLNARYALEVGTRVPVGNLERLIDLAEDRKGVATLTYLRGFAKTPDRPSLVFEIIADQLLARFDVLWAEGLQKGYERRDRVGSSPVGRLRAFQSAWRTAKAGRPVAASSSYERTPDVPPNRLLQVAFERLLAHFMHDSIESHIPRRRLARIRQALDRLDGVGRASAAEVSPGAVAGYVRHLPAHHGAYADALLLAEVVAAGAGLSIRDGGGTVALPSILVNMEKIYEAYARRILGDHLSPHGIVVLNGNVEGPGGAKTLFFEEPGPGIENPPANPDIVLTVGGKPRLLIDVKYRPPQPVPESSERNQVIGYGARYGCAQLMVLYAGRKSGQASVAFTGRLGGFLLYTGQIDLGAASIQDEEASFTKAVEALVNA